MDTLSKAAEPGTYLLGTIFHAPQTHGGTVPAIAVRQRTGHILVSVYTIMTGFVLSIFWALIIVFIIALFRVHVEGMKSTDVDAHAYHERGLVGFFNAKSPGASVAFLAKYAIAGKTKSNRRSKYITHSTPIMFAILFWLGKQAADIFIPSLLLVQNVAPPDPSVLFFPVRLTDEDSLRNALQYQSLFAPASIRAVGYADFTGDALPDGVKVNINTTVTNGSVPISTTDYNYSISGYDFGLSTNTSMKHEVVGHCVTDYSWLRAPVNNSGSAYDTYRLWNNPDNTTSLTHIAQTLESLQPPFAQVYEDVRDQFPPESPRLLFGNRSFAFLVHSSGRYSFFPSTDPWYATEQVRPNTSSPQPAYRVKSGRPPLSCWQKDSWSLHNGIPFDNFLDFIDNHTSLAWGNLLGNQFLEPKIVDVANSLGNSALISSTTSLQQVFDASRSSIADDMRRLVVATYIASRNVFRDSATVPGVRTFNYSAPGTLANAAIDTNLRPHAGVGQFVVSTPDVSAFDLRVIVAIPSLLAFLLACDLGLVALVKWKGRKNQGENDGLVSAYYVSEKEYQATKLYDKLENERNRNALAARSPSASAAEKEMAVGSATASSSDPGKAHGKNDTEVSGVQKLHTEKKSTWRFLSLFRRKKPATDDVESGENNENRVQDQVDTGTGGQAKTTATAQSTEAKTERDEHTGESTADTLDVVNSVTGGIFNGDDDDENGP